MKNKETEKLKETMVEVQVEQAGGHQYPPGSRDEINGCLQVLL